MWRDSTQPAVAPSDPARLLGRVEWGVAALIATGIPLILFFSRREALLAGLVPIALWVARTRWRWLFWATTFEMVLGGWGHAIMLGSLPIRHALLAVTMGAWAINKILDGDWRLRGGRYAWAAGGFLGFVVVIVLISMGAGNPMALEDGLTPAFLLLLFPLADIAARPGGPFWLVRSFLLACFVLAVVQIGLTAAVSADVVSGHTLAVIFNDRFGAVDRAGIGGPFWRVFIVGAVFYQVVILLIAAARLGGTALLGRRLDVILFGLACLALLSSYTRGFWLTTVIGLFLLVPLTTTRGRAKWLGWALVAVLAVVALAQVADATIINLFVRRIANLFNPDRDVSVALRLDLYPRLMARIAERPLFGYGFGLPIERELYYENSYLYYTIKFGLVGLAVMAWGWMLILVDGFALTWRGADARRRALGAGLFTGVVSMLCVTAINPFINSGVGLYFQALTSAVLYGLALETRSRGQAGSGARRSADGGDPARPAPPAETRLQPVR